MSTAFAGQFEDSPEGFSTDDRARIVSGTYAGQFGTIVGELVNGYYHVRTDGGADVVLETFELEPLIRPVMVSGGLVRKVPVKATDIADEIAESIIRLANEVVVPTGQVFDGPLRDDLITMLTELDDVIIDAVSAQVKIRSMVANLAAQGVA
jgi:hypothetical protein